jgi:Replication-relaxation
MTVEQVRRHHFPTVKTAANRLGELVNAGLVRAERPAFRGRAAYLAAPAGARLADVGLPAARASLLLLPHRLAVVDLADALLAQYAGATWVAERELRRDSMATVRDGRRGQLLTGTPHVPDGVLTLAGGLAIAVELELSGKTTEEYGRILRAYAAALEYRRVWWFCATPALQRKIAELIERERLDDFVGVWALPAGAAAHGRG